MNLIAFTEIIVEKYKPSIILPLLKCNKLLNSCTSKLGACSSTENADLGSVFGTKIPPWSARANFLAYMKAFK